MRPSSVIRGEAELPGHSNEDMPIWGQLLLRMSQGHEAEVQLRVANLNHYIESIQAKLRRGKPRSNLSARSCGRVRGRLRTLLFQLLFSSPSAPTPPSELRGT
jgi:hypothetical protein